MAKDIGFAKKLSQRLRDLATFVGGQRELARLAGIDPRRLHASIAREGTPGTDLVAKVCEATGCSVRWLTLGEGKMFDTSYAIRSLPILACEPTADANGICMVIDERDVAEEHPVPSDLHLVRVHGDSMSNLALDGQCVMCTNEEPKNGDLAVITTKDGELIFKRVYFADKTVLCMSLNHAPRYLPIVLKRSQIRRTRKVWGVKF